MNASTDRPATPADLRAGAWRVLQTPGEEHHGQWALAVLMLLDQSEAGDRRACVRLAALLEEARVWVAPDGRRTKLTSGTGLAEYRAAGGR